ncbi:hypothetical protein D9M70_557830 [compost metagenome]
MVCASAGAWIAYGIGYRHAEAQGLAELEGLRRDHADEARQAAEHSHLQLLQQVTRANQAEALLLADQQRNDTDQQSIEERIPRVITVYRPAPTAAPKPVPHCVFTVGWLRDYNAALGVPGAAEGPIAGPAGPASWAAPGTDAELLESGVTPGDILAHATDYGRWARNLASQVISLLAIPESCTP